MGRRDDAVVGGDMKPSTGGRSRSFIEDFNALGNVTNDFASFGLSDDGAGVGNVIGNILRLPFNPLKGAPNPKTNPIRPLDIKGAFERGKASYKRETDRAWEEMPNASKAAAAAGIVAAMKFPAVRSGKGVQTLREGVKTGAKTGALYGGLTGFGGSDGNIIERGVSSLFGAGGGALLGAGLPVLFAGGERLVNGARGMFGRGRPVAPKVIAQAFEADGVTPAQVGARVAEARARGVPLAAIDAAGDNTRDLGASISRHPGPGKTIIRDMAVPRQEGQADRLTGAIERDLGPIVNPRQQSERLMQEASEAADPFYAAFRANPGRDSPELHSLLQTPAGRDALNRARLIAANERRDPTKLGFDLDDAGETVLRGMPSPETVDLVKRGLDDIIEQARDDVTGRIKYTPYLRSVEAVRANLVGEADRLHPNYKAARQAFAGPAAAEEALRLGQKALNMPARDIEAAVARMSPAELQQFRLGYRVALSDKINRSGDYGDKVRLLTGTPEKRRALARAFDGEEGLDNFARTVADEALAQRTYQAVAGNSATAGRQLVDEATNDAGLFGTAADTAVSTGSPTATFLATLGSMLRGARNDRTGKLGEEVRGQIAAALAESDPAILREALRQAQKARAAERLGARVNQRVALRSGAAGGITAGSLVSPDRR